MAKQSRKKSGVRVYVVTVDAETSAVLKTEEEDPNSGKRKEIPPETMALAHDEATRHYATEESAWLPAGFQVAAMVVVGTPISGVTGDVVAETLMASAATGPLNPPILPHPINPPRPAPTQPKPPHSPAPAPKPVRPDPPRPTPPKFPTAPTPRPVPPTPTPMLIPVHHNGEPKPLPPRIPPKPTPTQPRPTPAPKSMPIPVRHNGKPKDTPPPKGKSKSTRATVKPPKL
jgi:hypothetical protein